MASDTSQVDAIEACRTCGVYYMSTTNYLKPLFQSAVEYPEMMQIRLELAQWKVEISEHDGLPQYVCSSCIHEFQKVFKFRSSCTDTQDQLRTFYNLREVNLANLKIKTEKIDPDEEAQQCNFIYVDDLSDGEYDSITPFNIPHIPIKEERIEEATVPRENGTEAVCIAESASEGVTSRVASAPEYSQSFAEQHSSVALSVQMPPPPPPPVECQLCQHLSPDQEEHQQHLRRVHEIRDMDCHICGKVFKNSTPSRFKFHLKWHNINKHVKCPQCGFVCNSRQALKEHKRAVHAKIYCKICGKGVMAKKMKSHLREHEVLTKFPCEYCSETFQSEEEREAHIWQTHADDDDKNETNTSHESLSEHLQNDESNEVSEEVLHVELLCAHCDQKFAVQSDLEMHVKEEHRVGTQTQQQIVTEYEERPVRQDENINDNHDGEENAITIFEDYDDEDDDDDEHLTLPADDSQYMSKSMQSDDNSSSHFQSTHNFTQYRSNATNSKFNDDDDDVTIEHFGQHQETLTEESMDRMETSSGHESESASDSDSNSNLSFVHQDIVMPFACAKCSDTFATIEQLRVHHQQHQEKIEKSPIKAKFSCNVCGKEFDLKFSLNRHMKKHNNSTQ